MSHMFPHPCPPSSRTVWLRRKGTLDPVALKAKADGWKPVEKESALFDVARKIFT